jgi:hypothetical protein
MVVVGGLGMPDSRDWKRTSVGAGGGLCRNEQRLRRGQDEGDGGGREEVRERMGTGEGGGQKAVM